MWGDNNNAVECFKEFQKTWTLKAIQNMTLEQYSQVGNKDTFTYWLEWKLQSIGSFGGGDAGTRFGIYHTKNPPKKDFIRNGDYAWQNNLGNEQNQVFQKIKDEIIKIINFSQNNELSKIDDLNLLFFGFKWKIALLYQKPDNMKMFCIFSKNTLDRIANNELDKTNLKTYEIYEYVLNKFLGNRPHNFSEIYDISKQLWEQYNIKTNDKAKQNQSEKTTINNDFIQNKIGNNKTKIPPLNQILYGPPGTGKTYSTINKALEILCDDKFIDSIKDRNEIIQILDALKDNSTDKQERQKAKAIFEKYRQNGQIKFITFHQSFSYEEFVEGIKPKPSNDCKNIIYEVQDGIFKEICEQAKQHTKEFITNQKVNKSYTLDKTKTLWRLYTLPDASIDNDFFDECIKGGYVKVYYDYGGVALNKEAKSGDYIVIPSTSYGEMSKTIRAFGILGNDKQISEKNAYCKEVEWLWVAENENEIIRFDKVNFNRPTFQRVKQSKEAIIDYMNLLLNKDNVNFETNPYILIIDEINRGNISKIFGELITLIEPSKRICASDEEKARGIGNESLEVTLPYSNKTFGVPSNLYIIGTMNTADRSIALLDTALRRRFEFVEMMPQWNNKHISVNCEGVNLQKLLKTMNGRIEFLLDREHTIGHSFFIDVDSLDRLREVFKLKIIPLLQEYFYDDYAKIDAVLNGNGMVEIIEAEVSKLFPKKDADLDLEDKKIYRIKPFDDNIWDNPQTYQSII